MKTTAERLASNNSPSPQKNTSENQAAMEDRKTDSPPRKYQSPSRTGSSMKKGSPSKAAKPFGQPIEIIKSK